MKISKIKKYVLHLNISVELFLCRFLYYFYFWILRFKCIWIFVKKNYIIKIGTQTRTRTKPALIRTKSNPNLNQNL